MAIPFRDVITNPPASLAEWEKTIVKDHGLHIRKLKVLKEMSTAHNKKSKRIEAQIKEMENDRDNYSKNQLDGIVAMKNKVRKLKSIVECCDVELKNRRSGVVKRSPR